MTKYQDNNANKTKSLAALMRNMQNDPVGKLESYSAIKTETYKLLEREKVMFMINGGITIVLLITLFKVV